MKKYISNTVLGGLFALALVLFSACTTADPAPGGGGAAGDDTWNIGITLQNFQNPYWAGVFGEVNNILTDRGWNFTILDSGDNSAVQISQIESFIVSGVDLIMVHPSDPDALEDVLGQAMDAGILVMSWDDILENTHLNWVLDNSVLGYEIGTAAANFINEHYSADNPAQVAVINSPAVPVLLERETGILQALEDISSGNFQVVASQPALDAATAMSHMETILQANPDVSVVVTIGGGGCIGANEAFMVATGGNIPPNMGVFSADASVQQLQAIVEGQATRTSVGFEGSSRRTALAVVDLYELLLLGEDLPRNLVRPLTPIDASNAAEFLADYN